MKHIIVKLQQLLKYTGCYCLYTWIVLTICIWTVGLFLDAEVSTIETFMILMTLFVFVAVLYFMVSATDDRDLFFQKLQKKGLDEAKIECPDLETFSVPKQTGTCPYFPEKKGPMEFTTSFFYLCNDSVTIYTKCAKFHIFKEDVKLEKKLFVTVKTKKESCEEIYEFYYYNMNYVTYEDKSIKFYFVDGTSRAFQAEKSPAKKVIKSLRKKMRHVMSRKTIHDYKHPLQVHVENLSPKEES